MDLEAPGELLRRLKLGRQEYVQRLLTSLILEAPYPRWNSRNQPSARGLDFLRQLEQLSFGIAAGWSDPHFVDELDLPRRHDDEPGSAPDWALVDDERLWMIELKTEAGSHRAGQIPAYFELGRHHFPVHRIDLTYLTGPLRKEPLAVASGSRFAHLTWDEVFPLVAETWTESYHDHVAAIGAVLADDDLSHGLGHVVAAGLIYAGLAGATKWPSGVASSNTLWSRITSMHLGRRHSASTLRRTLGSALASSFGWSTIDEARLIEWMHEHLRVVAVPYDDPDTLGHMETSVLAAIDPPLNLQGMARTPLRVELSRLRSFYSSSS